MTRKHFEAIAAVIHYTLHVDKGSVEDVATALADEFASFNRFFDREKFLTACGVS